MLDTEIAERMFRGKDVLMSRKRRSFTTEYKFEAARRVVGSGRTIAEVARELGINEALLGRWVADERTELARLRKQVSEHEKEIAFGEKASAYFAANQQK